jgi:hypothetical protein
MNEWCSSNGSPHPIGNRGSGPSRSGHNDFLFRGDGYHLNPVREIDYIKVMFQARPRGPAPIHPYGKQAHVRSFIGFDKRPWLYHGDYPV